MKHVFSETKVPTGMKQGEAHAMLIGKFMAVSVLVQGCAHIVGSDVNTRVLSVLLGCLVDIFKQTAFLRESVNAVLVKLISTLPDHKQKDLVTSLMSQIVVPTKQKAEVSMNSVFSDLANLALYLQLKNLKISVPEFEDVFKVSIFSNKKWLELLKGQLMEAARQLPRRHSALNLIFSELRNVPIDNQSKVFKQIWYTLFEHGFFSLAVTSDLKNSTKLKQVQFGLEFAAELIKSCSNQEALMVIVGSEDFVKLLIKNCHITKNTLHKYALDAKKALVVKVDEIGITEVEDFTKSNFGPNSSEQFTLKKDQDLLKALCKHFTKDEMADYFKFMTKLHKKPNVAYFYPLDQADDEEKDGDVSDQGNIELNKKENIQIFCLNQIANLPILSGQGLN